MKRFQFVVFGLAFAVVGARAQTPTPASSAQPQSLIIQRVLVKVNGEILTQTDLEREQTAALQDRNRQTGGKVPQNDASLRTVLEEITPDILTKAVDDLLLIQKAKELGYKLTDDKYQAILDNIKKENKLDEAGFKKALAAQGMTPEQLRANIEHDWLKNALEQNEILGHSQLTDSEARQYYAAHPKDFLKPATVVLREMLFAVPTQSVGGQVGFIASTEETAKQKATDAHDRLAKGEDFAKVAGEMSDSPSKANGGLIGEVALSDLADTLRAVVDKLKPGDVSEPIRTSRGYQIFKVDSRAAEQARPFEDVRDEINQKIFEDRIGAAEAKYLEKLRADALIEWKDAALKQMYEKRVAELKAKGQA